jgi:hypothetical protein
MSMAAPVRLTRLNDITSSVESRFKLLALAMPDEKSH